MEKKLKRKAITAISHNFRYIKRKEIMAIYHNCRYTIEEGNNRDVIAFEGIDDNIS